MKIKISLVLLIVFVAAAVGIGGSTFLLGALPQAVILVALFVVGMVVVLNRIAIENQQMFSDEFTKGFIAAKKKEEEEVKKVKEEDVKQVMQIVKLGLEKGQDKDIIANSLVDLGFPAELINWAMDQVTKAAEKKEEPKPEEIKEPKVIKKPEKKKEKKDNKGKKGSKSKI